MRKTLLCAVLAACSPRPAPAPTPTHTSARGPTICPSAVEGAKTRLRMTDDGVDVIVTTEDPRARIEIVKLAGLHARSGDPGPNDDCPIVHDDTRISLAPFANGIVLHLKALTPDRVQTVQARASRRLAARASQR